MLFTLVLAGIENSLNYIIAQSDLAQAQLTPLCDNTVQVQMLKPSIQLNVVFGEFGVRFEPVLDEIFEPQGGYSPMAHGYLTFADPSELLHFIKSPFADNIIYQGDNELLVNLQLLCQTFDFTEVFDNFMDKWGDVQAGMYELTRPVLDNFYKK